MNDVLAKAPIERRGIFDSNLLVAIRERFLHADSDPIAGRRIYLENGGGSLRLRAAIEKAAEILGLPDSASERTTSVSQYLARSIEEGKRSLHCLFGSGGRGKIVAGQSGTALFFRLIGAIAKSQIAGNFVSSSLEHPATSGAAEYWAADPGRDWRVVPFQTDTASVGADDYSKYVDRDTVLATMVHTSHLSGMRIDVAAVAKRIRSINPDCFILCDGIQHAPHGPISVIDDGVDGYVFAPYKAFSRRGGAFAWISERLAELPHDNLLNQPAGNWELGGPDPSIYASQTEVNAYLSWLGGHFTNASDERSRIVTAMEAINRHEGGLLHMLMHGRSDLKGIAAYPEITIVGKSSIVDREGAVCFKLQGRSSVDLVTDLDQRGIRVHYRLDSASSSSKEILRALSLGDCVRVTVAHFNTPQEIEKFLGVMSQLIAESKQLNGSEYQV